MHLAKRGADHKHEKNKCDERWNNSEAIYGIVFIYKFHDRGKL